ncbi:MAG: DUF4197 domain-containing protein [Proteobacteria bacterium]|nr:DUF4197 domain-containing protein [Pseudomonadota bacterium]
MAMKIFSKFVFLTLLFILSVGAAVSVGVAARAADEPRYQTWQGDDPARAALVERLNSLIDDAERARSADPNFLADLRAAIDAQGPTARSASEPVENASSASADAARAAAPKATAANNSDGSFLSTITDNLDGLTSGGGGLLDSITGGSSSGSDGGGVLSNADIGAGLRQALQFASEHVVSQLGAVDGFNLDSLIHIPLPKSLDKVRDALEMVRMAGLLEDLELRLNRAAELATPRAKELFLGAIEDMTLDDVRGILSGPDDAATQYFQRTTSAGLSDAMRPIIDNALNEAGAVQVYEQTMGEYDSLPFMPDVKADLTAHVLTLGLKGIFHYIAKEEASIRNEPVKRTTDLLRRVFG